MTKVTASKERVKMTILHPMRCVKGNGGNANSVNHNQTVLSRTAQTVPPGTA